MYIPFIQYVYSMHFNLPILKTIEKDPVHRRCLMIALTLPCCLYIALILSSCLSIVLILPCRISITLFLPCCLSIALILPCIALIPPCCISIALILPCCLNIFLIPLYDGFTVPGAPSCPPYSTRMLPMIRTSLPGLQVVVSAPRPTLPLLQDVANVL
jgi:hypothetical protein